MHQQGYPKGVMIHSDQGSQYCSADFQACVRHHTTFQSMSRRGNCWDNAVAESFFHTLKAHIIHDATFNDHDTLEKTLFEYIEIYYYRQRRHSANGWLTPLAFEQQYYANLEG